MLVLSDGTPVIIRAIETCLPRAARQRHTHRMRTQVVRMSDNVWPEFRKNATTSCQAPSRAFAHDLAQSVFGKYA